MFFLDVRTPEEFAAGHPPGAVNVPVMLAGAGGMSPNPDFMAAVKAALPQQSTPALVACKAGGRSRNAATMMSGAGYTQLLDVLGGFNAWEAAGLPVQK
jgi:rhodanese-related sulfurtransferase